MANETSDRFLEFGIDFLRWRQWRVLYIRDQLRRGVHRRTFDGVANQILLVACEKLGVVSCVIGCRKFRMNVGMNWPGISTISASQGRPHRSVVLMMASL